MSSSPIYIDGRGVIVSARGPGKVHLLSYASNANLPAHVGTITTNREGVTRFMISHSYTFTKFAFYWEGSGEAVCGAGSSLIRQPVGTSWNAATCADWGSTSFTTQNVSTFTTSAVSRDNQVTCFIIPDNPLGHPQTCIQKLISDGRLHDLTGKSIEIHTELKCTCCILLVSILFYPSSKRHPRGESTD